MHHSSTPTPKGGSHLVANDWPIVRSHVQRMDSCIRYNDVLRYEPPLTSILLVEVCVQYEHRGEGRRSSEGLPQ